MKSRAKNQDKKYDTYVEHPRYGRYPRHTGLSPSPNDSTVNLHWNAINIHEIHKRTKQILGESLGFLNDMLATTPDVLDRIAGTAIKAEPSKQKHPTVPVTHYFDVERTCRNCKRPFIFFAEEQRHWYEELRFPLEADCVRCTECRKKDQTLANNRAMYEKLAKINARDWQQNLKMAECALTLVENGVFKNRVLERVAALLKSVPEMERNPKKYEGLTNRLKLLRPRKGAR